MCQYCNDELDLAADDTIANFANVIADSSKIKEIITGQTGNEGTKNFKIMISLKYLSNFRRTLEMPLIKCEINHYLNWSENCFIVLLMQQIKAQHS